MQAVFSACPTIAQVGVECPGMAAGEHLLLSAFHASGLAVYLWRPYDKAFQRRRSVSRLAGDALVMSP